MGQEDETGLSEALAELVFAAIDIGILSVKESGGPLVPFVLMQEDGNRTMHRFAAEMLEESLEQARAAVASAPASVTAYALAYDGYVTIDGQKSDAVMVEGCERGQASGQLFAQRYAAKKFLRPFHEVGNPALIDDCPGWGSV